MAGQSETENDMRAAVPFPAADNTGGKARVKRHSLSMRVWHWINALCLLVLLMSGLMIFNAHPRLYWGEYGADDDAAWLEIGAQEDRGYLKIGNYVADTTGLLGVYTDGGGAVQHHAFPGWATIPSYYSLADARLWHLAFAWIFGAGLFLFILASLWNRHISRDLHIKRTEWRPSNIWQDVKNHARLRFDHSNALQKYNFLQKISYISVIFIALPVMIFSGLAMSPAMNAAWPWLLDIFAGRQSARSVHFLMAFGLTVFFLVHIVMVLLSGPVNQIRSMITGYFHLPRAAGEEENEQAGEVP